MYTSMTGFGGAEADREWGTVKLEISSVNHRYQEISVRLPKDLSSFEPWFHQKLRAKFRRGKVSARLEMIVAASAQIGSLNREAITAYYNELAEIRDELHRSTRDIPIESLLSLPGAVDSRGASIASGMDDIGELLEGLLDEAAERWNEMRAAEGAHLKAAIDEHLSALESIVGDISSKWKGAKDAAYDAMMERFKRALEASGLSPLSDDRAAQEAVIIADRWDIAEELARLASHIAKFREIGGSDEPVGRKLDFLVQEMNREINTISSKTADADIRWIAVEAKTAVERMREQIQNLE